MIAGSPGWPDARAGVRSDWRPARPARGPQRGARPSRLDGGVGVEPANRRVRAHGADLLGEGTRDRGEVDDRGVRRVQRADARHVGSTARRPAASSRPEVGDTVCVRPLAQRVQAVELGAIERHHELAELHERDVVRRAEGAQELAAAAAEARLQRVRGVVEAGMDDAAVVARLMGGEPVFLLEQQDIVVGGEQARGGHPDDAAADDEDPHLARRPARPGDAGARLPRGDRRIALGVDRDRRRRVRTRASELDQRAEAEPARVAHDVRADREDRGRRGIAGAASSSATSSLRGPVATALRCTSSPAIAITFGASTPYWRAGAASRTRSPLDERAGQSNATPSLERRSAATAPGGRRELADSGKDASVRVLESEARPPSARPGCERCRRYRPAARPSR